MSIDFCRHTLLPLAVDSLCLKVGWMEGGAVCRNWPPKRKRWRVRWQRQMVPAEHGVIVVLRDSQKERPRGNWLNGSAAQVWPGAVNLESGTGSSRRVCVESKEQKAWLRPSAGGQHPLTTCLPAWFCYCSAYLILSSALAAHQVTRGHVLSTPPSKLPSHLVFLLHGLLSPSGHHRLCSRICFGSSLTGLPTAILTSSDLVSPVSQGDLSTYGNLA